MQEDLDPHVEACKKYHHFDPDCLRLYKGSEQIFEEIEMLDLKNLMAITPSGTKVPFDRIAIAKAQVLWSEEREKVAKSIDARHLEVPSKK